MNARVAGLGSALGLASVVVFAGVGRAEPDPLISEMIRGTSRGHLEGVVRALSGDSPVWIDGREVRVETRRSGTEGMQRASRFLEEEFRQYGLEVRRQEYLGWILEDVAFADSSRGWAVGSEGTILRTQDGGSRWVQQGNAAEHLFALEIFSAECAVVVAHGGIVYRTEDGGIHWDGVETGSRALRGVSFVDSLNGWVCGDRGTVFRTRDAGRSWVGLATPVDERLHAVAFVDSLCGWASGERGTILRTEDGGRHWGVFQTDGEPDLYAICFPDSLNGWVGGEDGTLMATVDGGVSWEPAGVDTAVAIYDIEFLSQNRGWACGAGGFLFETTNGGLKWNASTPGFPADLNAMALVPDGAWIAGRHTLLASQDLADWQRQIRTVEGTWINVEATLPGTVTPGETYVLCGHFDSISEIPLVRAPGADDNASGTALVVSAARVLSGYRFEKSLKFVCFSGEEQGLRGSFNYVAELLRSGTTLAGVINADMVGYDSGKEGQVWIGPAESELCRPLAEVCSTLVAEYNLDLDPTLPDVTGGQSDHHSFTSVGIPGVMVSEASPTSYPYIHSVGDQYRFLNGAFAREITRLAVAAAATLAVPISGEPVAPEPRVRFSRIWPNPSSAHVGVGFVVPDGGDSWISIRLYDVTGRLVRVLVGESRSPGPHQVQWDGADARGEAVSPGVFFIQLEADGRTATSKILRVE